MKNKKYIIVFETVSESSWFKVMKKKKKAIKLCKRLRDRFDVKGAWLIKGEFVSVGPNSEKLLDKVIREKA
jgi:hypothetical protein